MVRTKLPTLYISHSWVGGTVNINRPGFDFTGASVRCVLRRIEAGPVVHAFDLVAERVPGRLSVTLSLTPAQTVALVRGELLGDVRLELPDGTTAYLFPFSVPVEAVVTT
jgi:hypothetical protein